MTFDFLEHALASVWSVVAPCFMAMAAYVALGLIRHAHNLKPRERVRWLAGAVAGLAGSAWSLPLLMQPVGGGGAAAYTLVGLVVAGLFAFGLSLGGLALASQRPLAPARVLAGAAVFGLSAVALPVVNLWALGLRFGHQGSALALGIALAVAEAGAMAAFGLFFRAAIMARSRAAAWQGFAALMLAATGGACHLLVFGVARFPPLSTAGGPFSLAPSVAATFAGVATLGLVLGVEMARRLDARMRETLERARSESQTRTMRDALTGLPNRLSFEGTLAQAVQLAEGAGRRLSLLLIGLDGMSPINVSHGHHGGDQAMREIAKRLRTVAAPNMLARLHSDEFLMLLPDSPRDEDATALAERVLAQVARPITLDGQEIVLSCSIGVAVYPNHGARSALIANASVAMRAAKRAGGATHAMFDARLADDATDRAEMLSDLRLAMKRNQLELYYQPKVHAPSGQITGAEALLRWHHPARGLISPVVFIPLAERNGLICALGDWVIEQACHQARVWRDAGLRMRVAINLSPVQLRQPDLAKRIQAALEKHKINPQLLTCEITESVAMEDTPATRQLFADLAEVGVHISIDDFGSGYANLANLRKLPASELKIDRSFVIDLATSEEARKVVQAVVNLAKALERQVVAEGVETDTQFQILRELGCDTLQGFLFAKPMSAKALGLWAMDDVGPRSIQFRPSLFKNTDVAQPA